jgi:hypothetical protein
MIRIIDYAWGHHKPMSECYMEGSICMHVPALAVIDVLRALCMRVVCESIANECVCVGVM